MDINTPKARSGYRPPLVSYVGHLADLTQVTPPNKDPQTADGASYAGVDIGS